MNTIDNLNKDRQVPKSKSTNFILPLLMEKGMDADFFIKKGFENCYIYKENKLIVVYSMDKDNSNLDEQLKKHNNYIESIDINDNNKIGYIFNIPKENREDVNLILQGKYSQINNDAKQNILSFWGLTESNNYFHGILYANEKGKEYYDKELSKLEITTAENEYFPIPNPDIENFENIYKK